jgi:hypothetical protein
VQSRRQATTRSGLDRKSSRLSSIPARIEKTAPHWALVLDHDVPWTASRSPTSWSAQSSAESQNESEPQPVENERQAPSKFAPTSARIDENAGFRAVGKSTVFVSSHVHGVGNTDTVLALILIFQAWLVQRSEDRSHVMSSASHARAFCWRRARATSFSSAGLNRDSSQ